MTIFEAMSELFKGKIVAAEPHNKNYPRIYIHDEQYGYSQKISHQCHLQ